MSTIEVPVGVVCACLPSIRSLFSVVFPRAFGSRHHYGANESYIRSGGRKDIIPKHHCHHVNSGITDNIVTRSTGNKINIRQEWTVLSDPFPDEQCPQHGGHRSDSDVELVGIGTALSTGGLREGSDHKPPPDPGTAVGIVSSECSETPWDGIARSAGGNGVGRTFYISSGEVDDRHNGSYGSRTTQPTYPR